MLEHLQLSHVGPADQMKLNLAPRLNLLTGDNGLGKSFLLDVAWWALTRTWAREMAVPHLPPAKPSIYYQYPTKSKGGYWHQSEFDRDRQTWPLKQGRPPIPGLVLYAQVDGGFSAWDPARNYWKNLDDQRPSAYLFQPREVWNGLDIDGVRQCNGLIADWTRWQLEDGQSFAQLRAVLKALSPSPEEVLEPGPSIKVTPADARRYPTLKMPYGRDVPLIHASAGMRRIVALAYLLVWTWQEHLEACELRGETPARDIIFLIDEVEAHLHPQWQRRIVPALLSVIDAMTGNHDVAVQLLVVTHAPLVLASVEPHFDSERDRLFGLDLVNGAVELQELPYVRRGDVSHWLTSDAFGLGQARSVDAEHAIDRARALVRGKEAPTLAEARAVDAELRAAALSDIDPFWVRWGAFMESLGDNP